MDAQQQPIALKQKKQKKSIFQITINGIILEWFLQSKIKDLVDHAGPSPPLDLWNPSGTFSEKERM